MKVGILGNAAKVKSQTTIDEIVTFVQNCGYETVRFTSPLDVAGVDVVIVLGGDGAILHSAVTAARNGVKIIGINYGNLGFLAEYEKDEREKVKELLKQIENGSCRILKRSLLQCEIAGKVFYALNEITVQRDYSLSSVKMPQILRLEVDTQEGKTLVSGDGMLICTPTGSTAYSLSAGGAILTPEVPVFMMTPICAFSMRTRPIVVSDTDEFSIFVKKGRAIVLADGLSLAGLPENARISIKKAPFTADFPQRENSDFFEKVKNKISE